MTSKLPPAADTSKSVYILLDLNVSVYHRSGHANPSHRHFRVLSIVSFAAGLRPHRKRMIVCSPRVRISGVAASSLDVKLPEAICLNQIDLAVLLVLIIWRCVVNMPY